MNSAPLFVRDVEGERRITAAELPLRLGTGSDCSLRLPGPGGAPVALIDLLDGMPFVQPVGRDTSLQLNAAPLEASTRLQHGDELQFFGSRIAVNVDDMRILLDVHLEDSAYITRPPQDDEQGGLQEDEAIAPQAFRRAAEASAKVDVPRRSPLKAILGTGLALLLLASYLLFSAKSVEFDVQPPAPDSLAITGGWFRLPIGDRTLLRKGTYTVNVSKQGYYDAAQSFVVGDEQSMSVPVSLRKKPGRLTVFAEPPVEAIVTVNDDQVGKAPFGPLELQPGIHAVRIVSERFLPYSDRIEIPGLDRAENLHVQLVPRWADVSIDSEPAGADIFAGEEKVGVTPAVIELLEGEHDITVSKDGYAAWDGNVIARPNVARALPKITLQPADARLKVNTIPRSANV
ncbi:MAG: PEGA domain-containing protein, partial [Gammaproteobacteria bacterium]|nr:PEGA domain-containing protein [Gammaproteobacteria bacterium]